MPQQWTWPAYVGIIGGAVLFVLFFVPIVLIQSRRYGRLSVSRFLVAGALAVYGVALVAYTLLPLPSDAAAWCARYAVDGAQLTPFQFLDDIRRENADLSVAATLRSRATLQVVFNVLLFVPWGVIVRRFFGRGFFLTVLSGFAVSVLIEATQYTGVWGLVGCSYRVADVDDVMMNTLGAAVGALVAPIVLRWMPRPSDLARDRGLPRPVTVWRRWLGMLVDFSLFVALGMVLQVGYRGIVLLRGGELSREGDTLPEVILGVVVPAVVVLGLPALTRTGASWGQRAMWMRPVWGTVTQRSVGTSGTGVLRLMRGLASAGLYGALSVVAALPVVPEGGRDVAGLLASLVLVVAFLGVPFSSGHRGVSYALTGARLVDSRVTGADLP